jgi:hypothetical protein
LARLQSGGRVGRRSEPSARASAAARPRPAPAARQDEKTEPRLSRLLRLRPDPIAELEEKGREIRDPVEKLRFLRRSLERYERVDQKLQAVPGAPLRWLAYRLTGVQATRPLFSSNPNGALAPPRARSRELPRRARRALNVAALLVVAAAGIALAAYPRSRATPAAEPAARAATPAGLPAVQAVAEALPDVPRTVAPERVWLVQSGKGFELYSNGLRIDTTYAVAGEPRRYHVFDVERGMAGEAQDRPIGIVFHTSESDIWPLEEAFNGKLRDSSQNLLHYLRKNKVYHYLIDRFGQVFRVVEEQTKANHAGMSVWSVGRRVFLNLNGPTIGVSFETRWEGGRALPITRAQLEAGRSLTDYLRQKWAIEPDLCVTHGLASVSPRKHLIGHHLDWARGFPFAAFGLPDQYGRPSPAVALFGFGHDEGLVERMGEPWPGVAAADRSLAGEADRRGLPLADLRRQRAAQYDRWLAEQAADADPAGNSSAEAQEPRRHAGGG